MCERPQTTTTISKRVPDGDGNRLKGVEVGVTAGEILRDGGLALPPTPASPSRSARGKEWRKRWGRKGEETIGEWRAKQVQVRIKRQNRKFVKKDPNNSMTSKFFPSSDNFPLHQDRWVNKHTKTNTHTPFCALKKPLPLVSVKSQVYTKTDNEDIERKDFVLFC
jgi:hypothetical protein